MFSPGVAAPLQNMVLRAQTYMGRPALGGFVIKAAVDSLSSLLEPMIMVVIGGLVGSLVVAMYLPIFKLASVV